MLEADEFSRVSKHFAKIGKVLLDEIVYTEKYAPGDIRLRRKNGTWSVTVKSGFAADAVRNEKEMPLANEQEVDMLRSLFSMLGLVQAPPWDAIRRDYVFVHNGEQFEASMQDIPNFARILEIEYRGKNLDEPAAENEIRTIMKELGVKPVNGEEFAAKIAAYKAPNKQ